MHFEYKILKGADNNFSSIWISGDKMHVGSAGFLTIVDLINNSVSDWYSTVRAGEAGEVLVDSDIVDNNAS